MQGKQCPMLNKKCIEQKCAWYTMLRGTNKNTGQEVDDWGCAVAWLPMLMIENANIGRQTGAAVESLRNESVRASDATRSTLIRGLLGVTQGEQYQQELPLIEGKPNGAGTGT